MKCFIEDLFSKCDQIDRKLRIWSHLLKKSLMENFMFRAVHNAYKLSWDTKQVMVRDNKINMDFSYFTSFIFQVVGLTTFYSFTNDFNPF